LAIACSLALAIGGALLLTRLQRQQEENRQITAQLEAARQEARQFEKRASDFQQQVEAASRTIEALQSHKLRIVTLAGGETQPKAWGTILWDEEHHQWHLFASGLAPPGKDKSYELWFITKDQQKIAAGTFDVDEHGRGSLVVSLPPDLGALALAAITDEPKGGLPQPTGSIQMVGEL
jgi:anti-sigma-K factor RskA